MFKSLSLLITKQYLRRNILEVFFVMALVTTLGLITLLLAGCMLFVWQWNVLCMLSACIGPWLLLVIALGIVVKIQQNKLRRAREELCSFQQNGLLQQVLFFAIDYLFRRRK